MIYTSPLPLTPTAICRCLNRPTDFELRLLAEEAYNLRAMIAYLESRTKPVLTVVPPTVIPYVPTPKPNPRSRSGPRRWGSASRLKAL